MYVDDIESAKPTISSAFDFLEHTGSIMIDLKNNNRSSPEILSQIENYFFKEKTHMNFLDDRSVKNSTFFMPTLQNRQSKLFYACVNFD